MIQIAKDAVNYSVIARCGVSSEISKNWLQFLECEGGIKFLIVSARVV